VGLLAAGRIPYALVGAMALNEYGYRRATVDVDILLTREGLEAFKRAHLGRGYLEKFPGSRGMRDTENGVNIDVVLAGEYPSDGVVARRTTTWSPMALCSRSACSCTSQKATWAGVHP